MSGRYVTFVPPEGAAYLIGDFTDWNKRPIPLSGPVTLEFPEGAYVEYAFMDAHRKPFPDPDNPNEAQNPWWSYPRAVTLPGHAFTEPPRPTLRRGKVHRYKLASKAFGTDRRYYVYEPPEPPEVTLFVQDGVAYYRTARLHEVAEALLERGEARPARIVFVEPKDRSKEYWFNPTYEAFLLEEVLPEVERQYGPTPERGLWGASLGALVSAWLAFRNPEVFQLVGMQSAALKADPHGGDSYNDPEWLTQQYARSERLPLRFYVETGVIEWLLGANRRFAGMLFDKGYPHAYHERPSGHNWVTWKQGLEPGIRYLLGRGR